MPLGRSNSLRQFIRYLFNRVFGGQIQDLHPFHLCDNEHLVLVKWAPPDLFYSNFAVDLNSPNKGTLL